MVKHSYKMSVFSGLKEAVFLQHMADIAGYQTFFKELEKDAKKTQQKKLVSFVPFRSKGSSRICSGDDL